MYTLNQRERERLRQTFRLLLVWNLNPKMVMTDEHEVVSDSEEELSEEETSEEDSSGEEESGEEDEEVDSPRNNDVAAKTTHAAAIITSQKENVKLDTKKSVFESQQDKAVSGSKSESMSQSAVMKMPHDVPLKISAVESMQNKADSGSKLEFKSQSAAMKMHQDVPVKMSAVESQQNKARSSSQVIDHVKPSDIKRPVEEMSPDEESQPKRLKNIVSSGEVASLIRTETGAYRLGLDDLTVTQVWETEMEEEKKKELEEKIARLKDATWVLQLQQIQLGADLAKAVINALRK